MGVGRGEKTSIFNFFFFSCFEFESSLVQGFKLFQEFVPFGEFCEICKNPGGSVIFAQGLAANWSSGDEKIALYIVCFAYSLLSLLSLVVVVVVFPLLPS